ncbi:Fic family protein [Nocardioides sp. W7]|uniref:Fic family protein n=1 Tax=Nocardioides sp. W7 TaxID=2931390 RepID=UPI0024695948|nr:Fic family protein [Nocardioides sp. W7]
MSEVETYLPPHLADIDPAIPSRLGSTMDAALSAIARLDDTHSEHLASLSTILLRAESVASSKIERIEASMEDYARALHGIRANASAVSMVASTRALGNLIGSVDDARDLTWDNVLAAHRVLMADDPYEAAYAGKVRDQQNWIGGSDHSPRNALYVPPPPGTVGAYLEDLVTFANRGDLNVLVQAAMTHAQFESIHPFTDGNGRIGRALINTVLRRRGATSRIVVPLASALVARRDDYFDVLGSYRDGDAGPIIAAFSTSSTIAAEESAVTAEHLSRMTAEWLESAGTPRAGSAARRIVDSLLDVPVFSAEEVEARIGGATSSIYAALGRLESSGVIRPLTNRARDQVWGAAALLDELDDLGVRIGARARRVLA